MCKYIVRAIEGYRFIAVLGLFGLTVAWATAQNRVNPALQQQAAIAHTLSSMPAAGFNGMPVGALQTPVAGFGMAPTAMTQPLAGGFTNPFITMAASSGTSGSSSGTAGA